MKVITRVASILGIASIAALAFVSDASAQQTGGSLIQGDQAPETALATVEGEGYRISASDVKVASGGEATFTITIEAKKGFKVNQNYPHKVKLDSPPDGVELPKSKLKKKDGKFEGKSKFSFTGKVKATAAGKKTLTGLVKTSVCNDSQCLIKKEKISINVDAS
jgi:hypothetical protein